MTSIDNFLKDVVRQMCDARFWVDRVHDCLDGKNLLEKVGFSRNKFSMKEGSSLSSNKLIMYMCAAVSFESL